MEGNAKLKKTLMNDARVSIEMLQERSENPRLFTQAELIRPPFQGAVKHSQRIEVNGLLDAGCFVPIDENDISDGRKVIASK